MTDHTPLTPEREQEFRESIPTVYGPPWTVHPDMDDNVWRVKYATDHPLAGLVCEVPDYGAHLAEFIAVARAAVPELLAEVDRLRGCVAKLEAELRIGAPWTCPTCSKENTRDVCVICETDRPDPDEDAPEQQPAEACGKCKTPFNPADTRFDGHAQHGVTPYCRRCVDLCHDNEIADHRCVICA